MERKKHPVSLRVLAHNLLPFFYPHLPPVLPPLFSSTLYTPPMCSRCCETNKSRAAIGWRLHACQGREKARRTTVKRKQEREGGREGEREGGRGLGIQVAERKGGVSPLQPSHTQPKADGRMFWPAESANREQGAAPSARAGPV